MVYYLFCGAVGFFKNNGQQSEFREGIFFYFDFYPCITFVSLVSHRALPFFYRALQINILLQNILLQDGFLAANGCALNVCRTSSAWL